MYIKKRQVKMSRHKLPHLVDRFISKKIAASFTVESSLIMPLVLLIILACITLSFRLRDKVIDMAVSQSNILNEQPSAAQFLRENCLWIEVLE